MYISGVHRMKRVWRLVGWFSTEEEMNAVRKQEKVSKRKSVTQAIGTKVFYRCNNWRRTNCNFRMYAMYYAPDKICLNASGEHDHSTKNAQYVPKTYRKFFFPTISSEIFCLSTVVTVLRLLYIS